MLQGCDLGPEFVNRTRGRGLIEDLLLDVRDFVLGCFIKVFYVLRVEHRDIGRDRRGRSSTLQQFELAEPLFQPLVAAAQRLVDRFG